MPSKCSTKEVEEKKKKFSLSKKFNSSLVLCQLVICKEIEEKKNTPAFGQLKEKEKRKLKANFFTNLSDFNV